MTRPLDEQELREYDGGWEKTLNPLWTKSFIIVISHTSYLALREVLTNTAGNGMMPLCWASLRSRNYWPLNFLLNKHIFAQMIPFFAAIK